MPSFTSCASGKPCSIYYDVRGEGSAENVGNIRPQAGTLPPSSTRPDVVLVMGFACTHNCWHPQLEELLRPRGLQGIPKTRCLVLDNRGVGRSGCPDSKEEYSTTIMATDILNLLDHLGWNGVHVIGHSMGAMIASKLAALAPNRVQSLVMISSTAGGWEAIPKSLSCIKIVFQMAFARSARRRAWLDVQIHFNKKMLNSVDERYGRTREDLLYEDYREGAEGGGPGQSPQGFWGQINAVLCHKLRKEELKLIKRFGIPTMVIHGRYDILAPPKCGEALARRFEAPCVFLEGAHMLCRERGPEVNLLIHHHIFHGRRLKDTQHKYLIGESEAQLSAPWTDSAESSPQPSPSTTSCSKGSSTSTDCYSPLFKETSLKLVSTPTP